MFKKLIEDLIGAGMTEQSIGQGVGASQASINRIKRTNQKPMYELGAALVSLHEQVLHTKVHPSTPQPREQSHVAAFGEFGEPRTGLERRDEDRRQLDSGTDCNLGEARDGDDRQDDRRQDCGKTEAAA